MTRQPLAVRAVNAVGSLVGRLGLRASLDPDELLEQAVASTGLDDYGPTSFLAGYRQLLDSLDGEAQLTTIGRVAARTRVLSLLETRLGIVAHRQAHPEVTEEPIRRPIFVLGLPRTGTTVLYGLLSANPALRAPASWEVARPFPPPTAPPPSTDPDPDRRIAQTERDLARFRRIAPGIDTIHPLGAELPQECLALQAPEFESYEFPTTFPVPSYWAWLRGRDLTHAYAFEAWFLQHLQSGSGGAHWILKTPAHLFWLDTLLRVFPDALLVHTHRDPATVLASVSSLMYALRSSVSDAVQPAEVGREQLDTWTWGLQRAMAVRDRLPADRVVDVHYEDTVDDPVGTVRRVYEHLGLEVTSEIDAGVRAYLDANPRDKHGRHAYDLADFGLDEREVRESFAGYRERFGR